jgi:NAD(P)-dependent dehydrogenase (short-subunit alcohol dehydrogenase family)
MYSSKKYSMKKDFYRNKVVVITGATGGVGRVTAKAFAAHGAKIALLARDWDQLSATKKEVQQAGGKALPLVCDVADAEQVEAAAEQVESLLGPIDVWVNNAMNSVFSPIINIRPAEFKRVTEVTYLGQVYGTLAALKRMQPRNKGSIVHIEVYHFNLLIVLLNMRLMDFMIHSDQS